MCSTWKLAILARHHLMAPQPILPHVSSSIPSFYTLLLHLASLYDDLYDLPIREPMVHLAHDSLVAPLVALVRDALVMAIHPSLLTASRVWEDCDSHASVYSLSL